MGRHSDETLEEAALSGCIYEQRRAVRLDLVRLREDRAELLRLEAQTDAGQTESA